MHEAMPDRINAARLAGKCARFTGSIPLDRMPRLAQCLADTGGQAEVEAAFASDAAGRAIVSGRARAAVNLVCQRCLEPTAWTLDAQFVLALVENETEAAALPAEYEPLLWPDGTGTLAQLVEDELLLVLPVVARHADAAACGPAAAALHQEGEARRDDNPFAALEKLKRKGSTWD